LSCASSAAGKALAGTGSGAPAPRPEPLAPPAKGPIPVAFLLSDGAVMIDFAGPWEVFQAVYVPSPGATMEEQLPFRLYTVAETTKAITASGGMKIVPDYDLASAPAPKIIVVPAQGATSEAVLEWMRTSSRTTDVTMSVCTGAFLLAKTGLLSGRSATTHHGSYGLFAMKFPDVRLQRRARFVEDGHLA